MVISIAPWVQFHDAQQEMLKFESSPSILMTRVARSMKPRTNPPLFLRCVGIDVVRLHDPHQVHCVVWGNVVGYAYRSAARIVCAASRPLASAASTVPISRPVYSASPAKNTAPPSSFRSANCACRVLGVA
jgi:hypothetical protein